MGDSSERFFRDCARKQRLRSQQEANGGLAQDCLKRAAALRIKAGRVDEEEAKPLNDHAQRLEYRARQLSDITPDDVLEAQTPIDGAECGYEAFEATAWLAKFLPKTSEQKAEFWCNKHNGNQQQQRL